MEHNNIIYLCSKEEWLSFSGTTIEENNGMHIADFKFIDNKGIRYNHTWYTKCYNTKLNGIRATLLIVGKGCEFDFNTINTLKTSLHPKTGVIQYGRA
jgi:hypothetical protein